MTLPPLLLTLCLLPGPQSTAQVPEASPLAWASQYRGDREPGAEVILDAWHWTHLWRRLERHPPPLDFTRYCAVVAFAGQRPTGGYTLEFLAPVAHGDDLLLQWRVRPPDRGAFVTEALTRPWRVEVLPRPKGAVKLERVGE